MSYFTLKRALTPHHHQKSKLHRSEQEEGGGHEDKCENTTLL